MSVSSVPATWIAVLTQFALGSGALAALAFAPPANGAMLLLPLTDGASGVAIARKHDALLVSSSAGGQLVVRGERDELLWPLMKAGILVVAAPISGCGEPG